MILLLAVFLSDRCKDVLHASLLAPHLRRLPLTLNIIGVNPAGIFNLDHRFAPVLVFHEEVRHIPALVLLSVNPRDGDAVPLHPLDDMRVTLQPVHHPPFEIALVLLEVPGALFRICVLAVYTNCHIR